MPTQGDNTLVSVFRALGREISGSLRFDIAPIGQVIVADGEEWTVFRKLRLVEYGLAPAQAMVEARFRMTESFDRHRLSSMLAVPLFAGMPGFRSKIWMHNQAGEYRVVYEWQTIEDAQRFSESLIVKMIRRRAVPGSVKLDVLHLMYA
jgi:hypothetical protein